MNLSDLSDVLKKNGAPILGSIIGGPAGIAVTAIGSQIASAFNADPQDQKDIVNKILEDPNAVIKLAEIESNERIKSQEFSAAALQAQYDTEQKDTEASRKGKENSRSTELELAKLGIRKERPDIIAYYLLFLLTFVVVALFGLMIAQITIPEYILIQVGAIIGFLTAKISSIVDYDFGDSRNSYSKDGNKQKQ